MPSSFQQGATQRFTAPPWTRNPNITDLIWPAYRYTNTDNASFISILSPAKGSNTYTPADLVQDNNFDGKGAYNGQMQVGGNSSYIRCDALASYPSGSGKEWSSIWAGNLPRTTNAGIWYVWSYTKSGSPGPSAPILQLQGSGTSSQDIQIVVRNDLGIVGPASSIFSPGRNKFILTTLCDGSRLTTRFNMVTVDNAIPWNPGTTTVNEFSIGLSLETGGFSVPNLALHATSPVLWTPDDYGPIESWLYRYLRF